MFDFIAFAFKLIFAALLGGAFSYISEDENQDRQLLVNMSMIAVLAASLVALTVQFPESYRGFAMGAAIFTVLHVTNSFSLEKSLSRRLLDLFASILGIIVGAGYIIQGVVLCILLYVIMKNSEALLNNINKDQTATADGETVENI